MFCSESSGHGTGNAMNCPENRNLKYNSKDYPTTFYAVNILGKMLGNY